MTGVKPRSLRRARRPATSRTLKGRGLTWRQLRSMAGGAHEYIVMCLSVEDAKRVHAILWPHLPTPTYSRKPGLPLRLKVGPR